MNHSTEMEMEAEGVRADIIESFAHTHYPGHDRLVRPSRDPDVEELSWRLRNRSWRDFLSHLENINGMELWWYNSMFFFFSRKAFYYYLPAFLIVVMDMDRTGEMVFSLIFCLDDTEVNYMSKHDKLWKSGIRKLRAMLSPQQRMAVQHWARYMTPKLAEWGEAERLTNWL